MNGNAWLLILLAVGLGLWAQYAVIKAAVHHALIQFLRDASRVSEMRDGHDVPRRVDRLAVHLAAITRRPPPDEPAG